MDPSPPQEHPVTAAEANGEGREDLRAEGTTESTGSVSMTSPEKKDSGQQRCRVTVQLELHLVNAKWPPENEAVFVNILLDEVLLGNCVTEKFTPNQWLTILGKLTEQCPTFYPYKIKQLHNKYQRLKVYWKRFHTLLTKTTGLSWDAEKKVIKGSEEAWQRWTTANRKDHDLENRTCVNYEELTTIFHGTTATGSNTRASTQRLAEE
ncbi:Unknown protein [Striga hermonthica]|uniref:Myb/SANT-like domain-containing protein n=1 Tax=Striga hermonthica TaxID=68872 RepID=A0A9N7NWK0_STRHE|nr:Unknown protein [Striga hermonthica]